MRNDFQGGGIEDVVDFDTHTTLGTAQHTLYMLVVPTLCLTHPAELLATTRLLLVKLVGDGELGVPRRRIGGRRCGVNGGDGVEDRE
jgi:hypothetical protein